MMGKGKHFPKSPDDIWKTQGTDVDDIIAAAKARKGEGDLDERLAKRGKHRVIRREE